MPNAPAVDVKFRVDAKGFSAAVDRQVKGKLLEMGATSKRVSHGMITDVQATSGALRLLDGGIQNNIRSAERYLASIKGVGAAMKAIYPTVGLIAVGAVIGRGISELITFTKQIKEASQTFDAESRKMLDSSRLQNDGLAKTNVELENQIAKLTGHHENVLAAELAQDKQEADKLAISAQNAAEKIKDLLDKSSVGFGSATGIVRMILGAGRTDINDKDLNDANTARANAQQDIDDALARGDQSGAEQARKKLNALRASQLSQFSTRLAGYQRLQREGVHGDQSENIAHTQLEVNTLRGEQDQDLLQAQNKNDEAQLKRIQDAQSVAAKAKETASKRMDAYKQQLDDFVATLQAGPDETTQQRNARVLTEEAEFWAKKLSTAKKGSEEYKLIHQQLAEVDKQANQQFAAAQTEAINLQRERQKFITESFGDNLDLSRNIGDANQGKDVTAMLQGMNESVAIANQNADAWAEAQIQIGLASGQLSKYDAAMQTMQLHRDQYNRASASISASRAALTQRYGSADASPEARAAFQALDNQQAQLNGQYAVQNAQDHAAVTSETGGGAFRQSMNQFIIDSRNSASQVQSIWSSTFSGINQELGNMLSGQRTSWSSFLSGIAGDFAKLFMQRGEAAIMGSLFGEPGSNSGGSLSGVLGGIGKFFTGLGFAAGGSPPVGMASLVGERGPELFVPRTAGTVIPNHALGGSTSISLAMDLRGAGDPAAVEAVVNHAFTKHAPTLISAALHAQSEKNARMPASRRR